MDANRDRDTAPLLTPAEWARVPIQERVLDHLGNLLLGADDLLSLLSTEEATRERWLIERVRHVYDEINALMKQISD